MDAAKPVACSCSPLPNTFICCRIAGDQRGAIVEASSRRHLLSSSANRYTSARSADGLRHNLRQAKTSTTTTELTWEGEAEL
jgi:hypothetical protein